MRTTWEEKTARAAYGRAASVWNFSLFFGDSGMLALITNRVRSTARKTLPPTSTKRGVSVYHAFVVVLAALIAVYSTRGKMNAAGDGFVPTAAAAAHPRYIVHFHNYSMQDAHRDSFHSEMEAIEGDALKELGAWRWVTRHNIATNTFPTDFGLVEVPEDAREAFLDAATQCASVRAVRVSETIRSAGGKSTARRRLQSTFESDMGMVAMLRASAHQMLTGARRSLLDWFGLTKGEVLIKKDFYQRVGHKTIHTRDGITGKGVKVGMFDSGFSSDPRVQSYLRNGCHLYDFTETGMIDGEDHVGHGFMTTFMIGSTKGRCPGIAPNVHFTSFRVFDSNAETITHWYMDALNLAIALKMDIINVSIGGNDYADVPFAEKFREACANGMAVFAATGNDGGIGSSLHPSNEACVLGVGAITMHEQLTDFTTKGVTIAELPTGFGRVKPDFVSYGQQVPTFKAMRTGYTGHVNMEFDCLLTDGTSFATPLAAGIGALVTEALRERSVTDKISVNGALLRQVLVQSAKILPTQTGIYGQGSGLIQAQNAVELARTWTNRATVMPLELDLTSPYLEGQFLFNSLYAGAMPQTFNVTVINSMHAHGHIIEEPVFTASDPGGKLLNIKFSWGEHIWPYVGWLGVHIFVDPKATNFEGTAKGTIDFTVVSPAQAGELKPQTSKVSIPVTAKIIKTPPREKRVLWDQFHSVNFGRGWIPGDNGYHMSTLNLDYRGDHPYLEYKPFAQALTENGYFLEILTAPLTCFDAEEYGHLIIMDPEDEFHPDEKAKLTTDVNEKGLSLIVYADWYDFNKLKPVYFEAEMHWNVEFVTGGSNIPALNDLLSDLGVAFADGSIDAGHYVDLGNERQLHKESMTKLASFPIGGKVLMMGQNSIPSENAAAGVAKVGKGHVSVFCDTDVLMVGRDNEDYATTYRNPSDEKHMDRTLLLEFLSRAEGKVPEESIFDHAGREVISDPSAASSVSRKWATAQTPEKVERVTSDVLKWSLTVGRPVSCGVTAPLKVQADGPRTLAPFFLPTYKFEKADEVAGSKGKDQFVIELEMKLRGGRAGTETVTIAKVKGGDIDFDFDDDDTDSKTLSPVSRSTVRELPTIPAMNDRTRRHTNGSRSPGEAATPYDQLRNNVILLERRAEKNAMIVEKAAEEVLQEVSDTIEDQLPLDMREGYRTIIPYSIVVISLILTFATALTCYAFCQKRKLVKRRLAKAI